MRWLGTAAVAAAGALALAAGPAAGDGVGADSSALPKKKTIKVGDNFYFPKAPTVKKGAVITWKWNSGNGETHDVRLRKGPRGVKKFTSDPAATDYTYKRRLRKAGTYRLVCTFHADMTMRITVKP